MSHNPNFLDRDRDYGRIAPPFNGAHFEQEGRYYGHDGVFLFTVDPETGELHKAQRTLSPKKEVKAPEPKGEDGMEILKQWARREGRIGWFKIKKAFNEVLNENPKNADEGRKLLEEKGIA